MPELKQIANILNTVTKEATGLEDIVAEDLSNIVDVGKSIFDATDTERYTRTLVDHIGKVIFAARTYNGRAPSVLMDGWEYGSILEKISYKSLPEAEENESWELQDGQTYNQDQFYKPEVMAKYFNKKTTFEIPISRSDLTVRSAFDGPGQMDAFFATIETQLINSKTVKNDELIMRAINNMSAETIHDEFGAAELNSKSGVRAVNLLYLYNTATGSTLTAANCLEDIGFLRFASRTIFNIKNRMSNMSTVFNGGKAQRFTPNDRLHLVLHNDFETAANFNLQSSTFHDLYTALPNHSTVAKWQASGAAFDFGDTTKIDVKTVAGNAVTATGIIGTMFDRDALGVANFNPRTTSHYNAKAEFTSMWHKVDASYFNDFNENFVVFFVA